MNEYLDLLRRNANYRYLWLGAVVSQIGDWFNLIASAALIANLTDSGAAISYLFLARFLPLFLFSPLAGVLADRFNRRNLMVISDVLRAGTVLGFLFIREPSQIWVFYVLTIAQFICSALFTPARTAILANIVAEKDLVPANALDSFSWSTMLAVGSLLGGVVTSVFGMETAFVMDAFTFLLSALLISWIAIPAGAVPLTPSTEQNSGYLDFIDGLRYLRGETIILIYSVVKGAGSLVWGAINVIEITFAEQVFPIGGDGSATLGWIYAVSGIGTGLGPLLIRRWFGDEPSRLKNAISVGFILMTVGIWGLSVSPNLAWYSAATLVRTVGSGAMWVFSAALLQMIVPDKYRGRVFAFEFALLTLTQSISIFWAGFAQDTLAWDVWEVTRGMSLLGVGMSLLWFVFMWWSKSRPEQAAS